MKYQTTKKAVLRNYNCLSVSYCRLQNLLHFENPESYITRREGWAADVYDIGGGVAIVTGYDTCGKKVSYDICKKYDEKAEKVLYQDRRYKMVDGKIKALEKLIAKFKEEVLES